MLNTLVTSGLGVTLGAFHDFLPCFGFVCRQRLSWWKLGFD